MLVKKSASPRFSGHETFVCRSTWLPKTLAEIKNKKNPLLFKDEDQAIVALGVGKNMVRSIRFWSETAQVIEAITEGGYCISTFGERLLGHDGHDPYLEDIRTLWLLHWKIASNINESLFYWHQMLNFWHRSEFSWSEVHPFFIRAIAPNTKTPSLRTLFDGFRVFVNSYVPTRSRKDEVIEDNLDCPFVELGLIREAGERFINDNSNRESIYSFNLDDKPSITPELFAYCLDEYWRTYYPEEQTLAFRFVSSGEGSPGQIFKLPEIAVRSRLDQLARVTNNALEFQESSSIQQIIRHKPTNSSDLLDAIYPVL